MQLWREKQIRIENAELLRNQKEFIREMNAKKTLRTMNRIEQYHGTKESLGKKRLDAILTTRSEFHAWSRDVKLERKVAPGPADYVATSDSVWENVEHFMEGTHEDPDGSLSRKFSMGRALSESPTHSRSPSRPSTRAAGGLDENAESIYWDDLEGRAHSPGIRPSSSFVLDTSGSHGSLDVFSPIQTGAPEGFEPTSSYSRPSTSSGAVGTGSLRRVDSLAVDPIISEGASQLLRNTAISVMSSLPAEGKAIILEKLEGRRPRTQLEVNQMRSAMKTAESVVQAEKALEIGEIDAALKHLRAAESYSKSAARLLHGSGILIGTGSEVTGDEVPAECARQLYHNLKQKMSTHVRATQ